MRILMLVSEYDRSRGFPRHGADLAVAFARRGHDVHVLTRKAQTSPEDAGVAFHPYKVPEVGALIPMALEPLVLQRLLRTMSPGFDAVLSIGVPVLAPTVLVGPGTHHGYVRHTLSLLSRRSPRRWLEPLRPFHRVVMAWESRMLQRRHPTLVVVGDERYGREYTEAFRWPAERLAVVPHGVDAEAFRFNAGRRETTRKALGFGASTLLLLTVAGRSRQKGLDIVIRALERLPTDRPWSWLLVGDGSTSRWLRLRTIALRRAGRVHLLGRVPSVTDMFSAADLFVFPSRYDPWGMVVTEALAAGLPVVCSANIGSAQAVRPGDNGDVLSGYDPGELAARIVALLDQDFDRAEVARTVSAFTWDASAAGIESAIARARARPGPEPA